MIPQALPPGRHTLPLASEGRERPFAVHVPVRSATAPAPLLVELHGRGIDPLMFDRWTGFSALADEAGFVLAMPSAVDEIWNDGRFGATAVDAVDDAGYLGSVIEEVCRHAPIDRRRIYAVGMSNGATMVARLLCEHADRFAAVAQVAGTAAVEVAAACRRTRGVPILQIHGTNDRFAPYAGGRAAGVRARLLLRQRASPRIGVDDWANVWVDANGVHDGPFTSALPPDTTIRRWGSDSPAARIAFYRVEGGGHTWPGNRTWTPPFFGRTSHAFDATRLIWEFLSAHAREA